MSFHKVRPRADLNRDCVVNLADYAITERDFDELPADPSSALCRSYLACVPLRVFPTGLMVYEHGNRGGTNGYAAPLNASSATVTSVMLMTCPGIADGRSLRALAGTVAALPNSSSKAMMSLATSTLPDGAVDPAVADQLTVAPRVSYT